MKKLLLLFCALLCLGGSRAWAYEATIADGTHICTTYGSFGKETVDNDKFTANVTSGLEGFKIVSTNNNANLEAAGPWTGTVYYLALNHTNGAATSNTLTLTAPDNYIIVGYTMTYCRFNANRSYTITPAGGSSATTSDNSLKTLTVNNICSQSTTITIEAAATENLSTNLFLIKTLTIVYAHLESTLSTSKQYIVNCARGNWAIANSKLSSTAKSGVTDVKNFAVVEHNSYKYLYCVTDGKYIAKSDLRETSAPASTFSWTDSGDSSYPFAFKMNGYPINSNSSSGVVVTTAVPDEGNKYRIYEVGDFNASSLTSALDAFSANTVTLTMNTSQGDFYRYASSAYSLNNTNGSWCQKWISSVPEAPTVTVELGQNGMTSRGERTETNKATYTISVPVGYVITGYTITSADNNANDNTVTSTFDGVATSFPKNTVTTKNVPSSGSTGVRSTQFTVANNTTLITTVQITVKRQTSVSALSSLSNTKCYTVESASRGNWAVAPSGTQLTHNKQTGLDIAYSAEDNKQRFAFVYYDDTDNDTDDGVYYLYSVSERKFIAAAGTANNSVLNLSTEATQSVTFLSTGDSSYPVCVEMSNGADLNIRDGASYVPGVVIYGTSGEHKTDGGNKVCIYEAGDFDPTYALALITGARECTYDVRFGGVNVKSATESQVIGEAPSLPVTARKDYCTYTYFSDEACTEALTEIPSTGTIYAKCTWAGPFDFSPDFASAKWYYMTLRNKYVQNDGNNPYLLTTSKDEVIATKGHWAFMGNPYAVKVINELAGDGKYLDDVGTNPQMGTTGTEWIITESSTSGAFQLHVDANKYISDNGGYGKFTSWNITSAINEDGGLLRVEEVPDNMMDQVTANIMPYVNYPGNGYFQLTSDEASMFSSAIETYNADGRISDIEYKTLLSYLNGYLSYPSTGYYLIQHEESKCYLGTNGSSILLQEEIAPTNVVKMTKDASNNYSISTQGKYIQPNGSSQFMSLSESPSYFTGKLVTGKVEFWVGENYCMMAQNYANDKKVWGYSSYGNSTKWTVENAAGKEFNISLSTVGSKSYATFSAPFPVTIGDGAKAYTVELTDENTKATYKEIPSKQIPAGAGILLISATAETSVTATVSATDFDALEDNDLVGYFLSQKFTYPTETSTWNLVLGVSSGTVGF